MNSSFPSAMFSSGVCFCFHTALTSILHVNVSCNLDPFLIVVLFFPPKYLEGIKANLLFCFSVSGYILKFYYLVTEVFPLSLDEPNS